jgi:hypothetical protein
MSKQTSDVANEEHATEVCRSYVGVRLVTCRIVTVLPCLESSSDEICKHHVVVRCV